MSIYKDCDIRGIYGEEFDAEEMRFVGRAIGRRTRGRSIVVAGDVRTSTPAIKEQLILGLAEEGARIIDIGTAPTPVAYFAKSRACFDAGALAIVTASHNPAKYNGIKLMLGDFPPTPEEILEIEREVAAEKNTAAEQEVAAEKNTAAEQEVASENKATPGRDVTVLPRSSHTFSGDPESHPESHPHADITTENVTERYFAFIRQHVRPVSGLKVVLDIGNGTTAGIAPALYRSLGYQVTELFGDPDGTFPNRNPNPADFKNLEALCAAVTETGADFGVAFDGDGDRAVFVDDMGRPVINEKSLIFLTRRALEHSLLCTVGVKADMHPCTDSPGFSVVYDQKCSRIVPDAITGMGGTPILERSGHAFIKKKFLENGSIIAGEISGHFFFKELGHDDGIYAGLCMGELLSPGLAASSVDTAARPVQASHNIPARPASPLSSHDTSAAPAPLSLSEMADTLPTPFISPDLRYKVPYSKMDDILARIKSHYEALGMPVSTYDGVRVTLTDGWFLVRRSVTEEAMTVKIEADSDRRIEKIRHELESNYFAFK